MSDVSAGVKPALLSKTVLGALVSIMAASAPLLGYALSEADINELNNLLESGAILVTNAIAIGGGLWSIYGRVRATKQIGGIVRPSDR